MAFLSAAVPVFLTTAGDGCPDGAVGLAAFCNWPYGLLYALLAASSGGAATGAATWLTRNEVKKR